MTNPLSITASVVGIVVPALYGTRLLLEDLQQLKDALKAVKRLVENVHSVDMALELLKNRKLVWLDRANVGFFKKDQLAINLIVGVATLYSSVRNSHITEEIKNTIATKQDEVKGAITTADKQLIVLKNKVEEMNLSDNNEEELLSELLSKSQEDAVTKVARNQSSSIIVTFGAQNLGFQAGNINSGVSGISFGK
ncbi:hypothetical protein B0J14DRAFT_667477 [Halenospora varia]|nr:hypothetical protein B0J14DRAFT_667477 [Halenospora varia]